MSWWKRPKPEVVHVPVDPEVFAASAVGTPLSHESVVLLARLQGLADRLEGAVIRLERQAEANEESEDADQASHEG